MNLRLLTVLLFITIGANLYGQGIQAYMGHSQFYSPKDGPYIETYVSVDGSSLIWNKSSSNKLEAKLELTLIFMKDSNIVDFSKVVFGRSEISDSSEMNKQIMNLQRFALPNGEYIVKIKMDDLNDTLQANYVYGTIKVEMADTIGQISSIVTIQESTQTNEIGPSIHSGLHLIPNIYSYFPQQDSVFNFYFELYNIDKSIGKKEPYVLTYYISNYETKKVIAKYKKMERRTAMEVDVIFKGYDISQLPSGNFIFTVELLNRSGEAFLKDNYFFQRENNDVKIESTDVDAINIINTFAELITGLDTLENVIRSMRPISSGMENDFAEKLIKDEDEHMMQQYIYHFWSLRNPDQPSKPFIAYMTEVMKVNKEYSTGVKKGYETDRGRIYLKFGSPNSIVKEYNEPATYPYEIWHFYDITGQNNVKFIFYNTDLATNEFTLLHSNAIGEVSNYQWQLQLRKRDKSYKSIDETGKGVDEWGTQYNEYWEQPR